MAYRAQDFFGHPSRKAYTELRKAAEKAKVWQPVRTAAIGYLETGRRPDLASAVAGTHPQVALDIWRSVAEGLIAQVKPSAYEEAAVYLRLMCKVYRENHRMMDWVDLLGELRREHKPKRRLMEVLDGLSGENLLE